MCTNASLDPSGNLWRLGAEVSRDARLRARSRSIYRARNQNRGVRTQAPNAPIFAVGDLSALNESGIDISDLFSGSGGPGASLPSVSVVPVPPTLPLLAGAIGLFAFIRRRA